ncbi:universal stress protein [Kibdelosporangium philippinense]|uniref:Universal stress protein n=1 Tax=Kibdelosporangium philippinense TaxID=211113 RepID=A0ABS8ZFW5_9PSEU|nr:universal stress protein [Kibdelosporangium philippinense]MCE7005953.1 universal stress protein [Kibdelosporangium philippinense]
MAEGEADFEIGKDGLTVIVVGVDGSPPSLHAAAWAGGLARRERAKLVLVYVEPIASPAYWTAMGMAGATEAATAFVDEIRREAAAYLDHAGIAWELVHYRGDPAHGLEAIAEERRADCIVVGRSRHGGGLVGSVPKMLVKDAKRPVVVVP